MSAIIEYYRQNVITILPFSANLT